MKYISTHGSAPAVSFREAVMRGQAPDGGLYMPELIPRFPSVFFQELPNLSWAEIAFRVARPYIDEDLPDDVLWQILTEALNFNIPLIKVRDHLYSLELFHGPTLAFKDVGARFMSRCMAYFSRSEEKKLTILVATSGDTGSAVANGFLEVEGVEVVILYPRGKVSEIQESQFTTLGRNITALAVEGTFDDCQRLVKTAFADEELKEKMHLSSANSINIGRLLPQSFYYYYAQAQLCDASLRPVISVPSGNFGNLTSGLMAAATGLPVAFFVAATNANKVFPEYLASGTFTPQPSVETLSSAMDVGNPSNLARIRHLFDDDVKTIRKRIRSFSFTDEETRAAIHEVAATTGYVLDPHGAVGYLGLVKALDNAEVPGIFLATAHPAKFKDVVAEETGKLPEIPERLARCMGKEKMSIPVGKDYGEFREFLLKKNQ
jgi:threonine synthase